MQLLLRQVDDFLLTCNSEQAAKDIFTAISTSIQFDTEKRDGIIPFEFLGIVKDYNGVDIKQTKDYIEMSCANYIRRLLKSHGWDKDSSKPLPSEMVSISASNSNSMSNSGSANVNASDGIANSVAATLSIFVEDVTELKKRCETIFGFFTLFFTCVRNDQYFKIDRSSFKS